MFHLLLIHKTMKSLDPEAKKIVLVVTDISAFDIQGRKANQSSSPGFVPRNPHTIHYFKCCLMVSVKDHRQEGENSLWLFMLPHLMM